MPNFNSVVLTTDFSPNADKAIPFAIELAKLFGCKIHLVHVFEELSFLSTAAEDAFAAATASPVGWTTAAKFEHQTKLDTKAAQIALDQEVEVIPVMRIGRPANEVVSYAKGLSEPCIVIASHGRTGLVHLPHLVFGSVAEHIVRMSPVPVLSVPTDRPVQA